jgi:hypothetical protein
MIQVVLESAVGTSLSTLLVSNPSLETPEIILLRAGFPNQHPLEVRLAPNDTWVVVTGGMQGYGMVRGRSR